MAKEQHGAEGLIKCSCGSHEFIGTIGAICNIDDFGTPIFSRNSDDSRPSGPFTCVTCGKELIQEAKDVCEECGEKIPDVPGGGLENKHHAKSCSLYDPEKE